MISPRTPPPLHTPATHMPFAPLSDPQALPKGQDPLATGVLCQETGQAYI